MTAWTLVEDERYYGLSRSLYRAAASCAKRSPLDDQDRLRLLDACQYAIQRLADAPSSARCVRRWLYREVRSGYALEDQPILSAALGRMIGLAVDVIAETKRNQVRPCSALTRGGSPCQRQARPDSELCPSHRHLEILDDPETLASSATAA
jgi:hypothetical protein